MLTFVPFLAYSVFCYWVIVRDGAEVLDGWGAFALMGAFAASLTPTELRFYVGISWLASLVLTLFFFFSDGAT